MTNLLPNTMDIYSGNIDRYSEKVQAAMSNKITELLHQRNEQLTPSHPQWDPNKPANEQWVRAFDVVSFFGLIAEAEDEQVTYEFFIDTLNIIAEEARIMGTLATPFAMVVNDNFMNPTKKNRVIMAAYFAIHNQDEGYIKKKYKGLFFQEGGIPNSLSSEVIKEMIFNKHFDKELKEELTK